MNPYDFLERITDPENRAVFENLYKAHDMTQKKIDILTDLLSQVNRRVDIVQEGVRTNTDQLYKISKQIERDCAHHLIKSFPNLNLKLLSKEDYKGTYLANHEMDAVLLSEDGKILIIAETKHDLSDVAFNQLGAHIADFYKSKQLNKLTSILKSVEIVVGAVGAVGADIVNENKAQEVFDNGFLLISKENKYRVRNVELIDQMLNK